MPKRTTIRDIQAKANDGQKISMVTAYDAFSAKLVEEAGIDIALVGDSVGTTLQGRSDTLGVEMEDMLYHAEIVARSTERILVIGDLPFGSYQVNEDEAMQNAVAFLKAGAHAVKLEGGASVMPIIERMCEAGIPVMGHLGLTPQSIYRFGTYKVRAREEDEADILRTDAVLLDQAGCFALVLEKIPASLAEAVSKTVSIPTIGIGAGSGCDGQVLVTHDAMGLTKDFNPRFVRRYADLSDVMGNAVKAYIADVRSRSFPAEKESY